MWNLDVLLKFFLRKRFLPIFILQNRDIGVWNFGGYAFEECIAKREDIVFLFKIMLVGLDGNLMREDIPCIHDHPCNIRGLPYYVPVDHYIS